MQRRGTYVFTTEPGADGATVYSRMVGATGSEDPTAGSASGPLGAYLVRHGASAARPHRFVSRQGVKMRRPCEIHIRIDGTAEAIERVEVGGTAICAGEGQLEF